jgi:hypothetical protein
MIHIRNAVKVRASGKIKSRTIHSGAFYLSAYNVNQVSEGGRTSSSTSTVPTEYMTGY